MYVHAAYINILPFEIRKITYSNIKLGFHVYTISRLKKIKKRKLNCDFLMQQFRSHKYDVNDNYVPLFLFHEVRQIEDKNLTVSDNKHDYIGHPFGICSVC